MAQVEVQGQLQVEVQVAADGKEREQHLQSASSPPDVRLSVGLSVCLMSVCPALRCPSYLVRCCRCCFRLLDSLFDLCSFELDSLQLLRPSLSLRIRSLSRPCVRLLQKRLLAGGAEEGDTGRRERWLKRSRDPGLCGSGS